jgi:PAS domain S-box-containing protein
MSDKLKNKQELIQEIEKLKKEVQSLKSLIPGSNLPDSVELLRKISSRYIDLYDNAPDMFFSVRKDGTILSLNETGARHLGYSKEELVGQLVWKVVYEEDLKPVKEKINEIIKNKKIRDELEFRKVKKNGSIIYVHERTKLVFDVNGNISELRIICRDITDRKKDQTRLQIQEEKYRTLAFNLNVGLYRSTADKTGSFIEINPAFVRMLG